ncbi:hypothetical protein BU26DRAFT_141657 [Trematosphaeria pertusa]|uniref:Mid2 domain-containing protein n=1 Tax=Trematosphaeria pertusa TaxID=390896 RepID=A0A6A6IWE0_9PLEO|nr:uncharacterized protein BU26DRAFT_141657 [Trematosphaeria pertusa]KAF2254598.1 hypothetical protein BU26DRAFT_141657 [Trematosphaeria pertusa]
MYFLIRLAAVVAFSSSALATCYFPNGDVSGADTACTPNSIVSACCFDGQACLSNGLCVSDPHSSSLARLHRGTCTDQQWKSGNCPKECTSVDNNGVPVYSCNSTSTDEYCCFDNCECNSGFETFSFQGAPSDVYTLTIIGEDFTNTHVSTTAAATSTSGTSTGSSGPSAASATTTATSTSSSSPANSDDGSSSNATAVGVGVGVGVGGALLLAAAGLFFWRRKKRNDTESNAYAGSSKNPAEAASTEYYPPAQKYAYYSEELRPSHSAAPMNAPPSELPSDNSANPAELPASPPPNQTGMKR